jgi:hypothetical protein
MSLESTKKIINEQNYEVGHFSAIYNYNLFIKFGHVTGDAYSNIGAALANADISSLSTLLNSQIDFAQIGQSLNMLVSSLYQKDRDGSFMLELLAQTRRNGIAINKDTFNQFYTGNMKEAYQALMFSINVHFNFFSDNKSNFGSTEEKERKKTNSAAL